jgi:N-acetylmuramoyl-L-alanine amidase
MGILTYPPNNHQTDSPTIFFIGSATESCVINDRKIELVYAGNFCPVFDLDLGENVFEVNIDGVQLIFNITRVQASAQSPSHSVTQSLSHPVTQPPFHHICIDPGHGGSARGTCSPKGIKEKDLNLSLAEIIRNEIISSQSNESLATVLLTRDTNIDLSLEDRVQIACDNNCDLFISVHHNAIPDDENPLEHRGLSVHYYYDENIGLAEKLLEALTKTTGLSSAGIIKQNLHVLRENTKMPAVLIEFGYLIHPFESEVICGVEFQNKAAKALVSVLLSS